MRCCRLILASLWTLFLLPILVTPAANNRQRFYSPQHVNAHARSSGSSASSSAARGNGNRGSSQKRRGKRQKPNVIFIMADDVGWNDVGFHNPLVKTPNIDWLARNGIELTDMHAQTLCSPSRAAVLTGKYPSNNGMQQLVQLGQSKSCLPLENRLWPQYMKERGYITKMVGKWHLGACDRSCLPTNRGFDEFRGILENQAGYFNWTDLGVMNRMVNDQPSIDGIGTHLTVQHKLDTVDMIRSYTKSGTKAPLFMYLSPLTAHQPLDNTPEMFARHSFLNPNADATLQRRKFLGLVSALDDLVGALLRTLKQEKILDNTYIIFTSDNGGPSGDLDFPAPFPFVSFANNYPLRGGKSSFFDGGTRSPTVFFKKGQLSRKQRGKKRDFLMHITDWVPTILDIVDPNFRAPSKLDGISQKKNLLRRVYSPSRKYAVRSEYLAGLTDYTAPRLVSECSDADAGYRWMDWKLIYGKVSTAVVAETAEQWTIPPESPNFAAIDGDSCMKPDGNGGMFARCLFNLKADPLEQHDLFDQRPDIVRRLLEKINYYKRISKQSIFSTPLPPNDVTTRIMFGDVRVPRFDYCTPAIDFPLRPRNASCNANLNTVVDRHYGGGRFGRFNMGS